MTKAELRHLYLSRQRGLSPSERSDLSGRIADVFFASTDLGSIKTLHCFMPIEKFNEIDTMLIFHRIWNEYPHIQTAAPRADLATGELESVLFRPGIELSENKWGIREPATPDTIDVWSIDIVLVPTLCFDKRGYRVGYGKGFYDRFLIRCRENTSKIGLSYSGPVENISDIGDHDVKLDRFITPEPVVAKESQ